MNALETAVVNDNKLNNVVRNDKVESVLEILNADQNPIILLKQVEAEKQRLSALVRSLSEALQKCQEEQDATYSILTADIAKKDETIEQLSSQLLAAETSSSIANAASETQISELQRQLVEDRSVSAEQISFLEDELVSLKF